MVSHDHLFCEHPEFFVKPAFCIGSGAAIKDLSRKVQRLFGQVDISTQFEVFILVYKLLRLNEKFVTEPSAFIKHYQIGAFTLDICGIAI